MQKKLFKSFLCFMMVFPLLFSGGSPNLTNQKASAAATMQELVYDNQRYEWFEDSDIDISFIKNSGHLSVYDYYNGLTVYSGVIPKYNPDDQYGIVLSSCDDYYGSGCSSQDYPLIDGAGSVYLAGEGYYSFQIYKLVPDIEPPTIDITNISDGEVKTEPFRPAVVVKDKKDPKPTYTMKLNGQEILASHMINTRGLNVLEVEAINASGNKSSKTVNFTLASAKIQQIKTPKIYANHLIETTIDLKDYFKYSTLPSDDFSVEWVNPDKYEDLTLKIDGTKLTASKSIPIDVKNQVRPYDIELNVKGDEYTTEGKVTFTFNFINDGPMRLDFSSDSRDKIGRHVLSLEEGEDIVLKGTVDTSGRANMRLYTNYFPEYQFIIDKGDSKRYEWTITIPSEVIPTGFISSEHKEWFSVIAETEYGEKESLGITKVVVKPTKGAKDLFKFLEPYVDPEKYGSYYTYNWDLWEKIYKSYEGVIKYEEDKTLENRWNAANVVCYTNATRNTLQADFINRLNSHLEVGNSYLVKDLPQGTVLKLTTGCMTLVDPKTGLSVYNHQDKVKLALDGTNPTNVMDKLLSDAFNKEKDNKKFYKGKWNYSVGEGWNSEDFTKLDYLGFLTDEQWNNFLPNGRVGTILPEFGTYPNIKYKGADNQISEISFDGNQINTTLSAYISPYSRYNLIKGHMPSLLMGINIGYDVDDKYLVSNVKGFNEIKFNLSSTTESADIYYEFNDDGNTIMLSTPDNKRPKLLKVPVSLEDGIHTLKLWGKNSSGNLSAHILTEVEVDKTAPKITVSNLNNGDEKDSGFIPDVSATDKNGLVKMSMTLNGKPYNESTPITDKGSKTLVIEATDVVGNKSTESRTFTIKDDSKPIEPKPEEPEVPVKPKPEGPKEPEKEKPTENPTPTPIPEPVIKPEELPKQSENVMVSYNEHAALVISLPQIEIVEADSMKVTIKISANENLYGSKLFLYANPNTLKTVASNSLFAKDFTEEQSKEQKPMLEIDFGKLERGTIEVSRDLVFSENGEYLLKGELITDETALETNTVKVNVYNLLIPNTILPNQHGLPVATLTAYQDIPLYQKDKDGNFVKVSKAKAGTKHLVQDTEKRFYKLVNGYYVKPSPAITVHIGKGEIKKEQVNVYDKNGRFIRTLKKGQQYKVYSYYNKRYAIGKGEYIDFQDGVTYAFGWITVKEQMTLYKANGKVERTLKVGDKYRVYQADAEHLHLGGGYKVKLEKNKFTFTKN